MASPVFVLVDGMAVLYRSFYAIRGLATKAGRPTNAVFGFIRAMDQLRRTWSPTHWLVAFDGGLPRERLALMETYKAQRPPMPDALRAQLDPARDYLERAGIPWRRLEGEEADDVIASLATWARSEADRILIASSDKDLLQLVDERVHVVSTFGRPEELDAAGVKRKTGVEPSRIVEWLALTGDASDNIPGVPGVGAKTAAALLEQYGSLEGIWRRLADVHGEKLRQSLEASRGVVERNLGMVRLKAGLACGASWDSLAVRAPDPARLVPFLRELEFESMAREVREPELFG
jgi:DNA polymerase-1